MIADYQLSFYRIPSSLLEVVLGLFNHVFSTGGVPST